MHNQIKLYRSLVLLFTVSIIMFILMGWILNAHASETLTICLKTKVAVAGEKFSLKQIADISGRDAALVQKISIWEMGSAPFPGQSMTLFPAAIAQKLKSKGLNPDRYQLIAQGPVKINRKYDELKPEQIKNALQIYIQKNAPWPAAQMKIRPIAYRQTHKLPAGKVDFQIRESRHSDWSGAETFTMRVLVNGTGEKKIFVPVFIEVWGQVIVAARPLGRGQPIREQDLVVQKIELSRAPANALVSKTQAVGTITKRAIAIHSILRDDQIETPPLIRKGDLVQVVAETTHIKISTRAIAREDGCHGDRIELVNWKSKQKIYAQVVDSETVKVQF